MTRQQVAEINEIVSKIQATEALDAANAIQSLIESEVEREREECAHLAESAAGPAGYLSAGHELVDPKRKAICLEIARQIRRRGLALASRT